MQTLKFRGFLFMAILFLSLSACAQSDVFVNGKELSSKTVQNLSAYYKVQIQKGSYWYDPTCGLWGFEGGEAVGLILAGLDFGGTLSAKASNGKTGIFINGRQINASERWKWQQLLGQTIPGRYRLDAWGNLSYERGGFIVNVVQLSQQNSSSFYRSSVTDIGTGGDGSGFYVIGKDFSYSRF